MQYYFFLQTPNEVEEPITLDGPHNLRGSHLGGERHLIFVRNFGCRTRKLKLCIHEANIWQVDLNAVASLSRIGFHMPGYPLVWPNNVTEIACTIDILNEEDKKVGCVAYSYINYGNELKNEHFADNYNNDANKYENYFGNKPKKEITTSNLVKDRAVILANKSVRPENKLEAKPRKAVRQFQLIRYYGQIHKHEPEKVKSALREYDECKWCTYNIFNK